uniref:5-methyltetrahydropteroyltriglutamate--homocysteine S-methyltransferase n=1 Tax=Polytomella parva TaxID=51329 RepID=A0A7S0UVU7_9CHLO|nr:probable 5-methyltetrahydropteroyltriglutamate-homocysteine methyltransferase (MET26) [Polytomella parva]|mmetsp:Transcript_18854/g.34197  ORF Transcript_18854/g.34197 Transcript_18854/m.34197 type:complete len:829 (+) Transcript_18854:204-2690(+)|eukprot:CAMPEP_0175050066 /NCGR_PEP_ID=MMETSP0052_2-20121109/7066_1 /TAXON_ID=51329 ORGANISM="Polytomella parva, Strain SAG 63-3" /NCGR_SAMPLE_ID=MMETSP0052_2 /ASSEMBLY_ACC=CAM_ASM_000194 /LENGTH=828 /DNA_ID=CAMNT_0016314255 /DNA_START=173 /DNA_END=2659 /DNA_ORIENTATION=+
MASVTATNLGFPRMGADRDLKKLVEAFWAKKIDQAALLSGAKELRAKHWQLQQANGIASGHIPSNDFSFYDHILDHCVLFGVIPERYHLPALASNPLAQYFAMGRGHQELSAGIDLPSFEMKKWFDTNYHYMVPEFSAEQTFKLPTTTPKPVSEFLEAKALGIKTRPVLVGPVTFLHIGKSKAANFQPVVALLDRLLPLYVDLIKQLVAAGAEWIQIDEPVLSFDLPYEYAALYDKAYAAIREVAGAKILVANYFGRLGDNFAIVEKLPIDAFHVDLVRAPQELEAAINIAVRSKKSAISLGVVNGRNIWKADLNQAIEVVKAGLKAAAAAANGSSSSLSVFVAPSCSLLHSPHSLEAEVKMRKEIKDWLSFAVQKLGEVSAIAQAVDAFQNGNKAQTQALSDALASNAAAAAARKVSPLIHNAAVKTEVQLLGERDVHRRSVYNARWEAQQAKLKLPAFPTTTVGSFPQTAQVRVARRDFKAGQINQSQYDQFLREEIERSIRFQEKLDISVLVHGEFERNDMVEYFGEQLQGYVFSQNGWVQSYGSRCVKPPIIYGDVSRPTAMTVEWTSFAQSLTSRPMKGMLTGPVTMLQWSFVRDDIPRRETAMQLAVAIRKEVLDLEKAGIQVIQVDEPAIREGLPLRKADWQEYLEWAARSFKISVGGSHLKDETQIHTHMCYSDFNDIFPTIQALDADVITIENSKSDLKLLAAFEKYGYANGIGPGLYDIHSPRVPSVEEMDERFAGILKYIPVGQAWVNPDCGLKTRGWPEVEGALKNMCAVADNFRKLLAEKGEAHLATLAGNAAVKSCTKSTGPCCGGQCGAPASV